MRRIIIFLFLLTIYLKAETINPDAVYERLTYEYILNNDGSIEFNYEHSLRYLTYFAINRLLGESFVVYNPDYQVLKITKSETIMSNGVLVKAPINAFNEVLPKNAANTAGYFNLREMVVTHTGLERNCVVNFGYKITTKAGFLPGLFGDIVIGGHHPIKYFEIVIKVPAGKKLNLFMANNGPMGNKSSEGEFDVYKWQLKNIPMIPVESNQPDFKEYLPTLYFSTLELSQITESLAHNKELILLDGKAKNKVQDLISGKFTFFDKVMTLRNYVFSNISGSNFDLNLIGFKPQPAIMTFERGSGSYLDKAILLKAMCEAVGINTELAFCTNYSTEKPDLTLFSEFNVFLVHCKSEDDDQNILLDPNNNQTSLFPESVINKTVFSVGIDKVYLIKPFETHNLSSFKALLNYKDLKLTSKYVASGQYVEDLDINAFNSKFNSYLKSRKFEIDEKATSGKVLFNLFEKEINCKIIMENYTDEIIKLEFPPIIGTFNEENIMIVPTSRISPIKLKKINNEDYEVIIKLDDCDKRLLNPVEIEEENDIGLVEIKIQQIDKEIKFKRKLVLKRMFIDPKDYHFLYKIISLWDNVRYRYVYLK